MDLPPDMTSSSSQKEGKKKPDLGLQNLSNHAAEWRTRDAAFWLKQEHGASQWWRQKKIIQDDGKVRGGAVLQCFFSGNNKTELRAT